MKSFENKVVVITGAGSGMGRAYAVEFAKLGARLALNDYNEPTLLETRALALEAGAPQVHCEVFDVSSADAFESFASDVQKTSGNAHVIINNAGVASTGLPTWDLDRGTVERVMAINFWGVFHGTSSFLPQLIENGEGAVVNVSSVFGLVGTPGSSAYCASKFAVRGFTESLVSELADSPITAHIVHPGGIATNISQTETVADRQVLDDFSRVYLTTSPESVARRVIRGIRRGEPRIVYGNQSLRLDVGSRFVPLRALAKLLWTEYTRRGLLDLSRFERVRR